MRGRSQSSTNRPVASGLCAGAEPGEDSRRRRRRRAWLCGLRENSRDALCLATIDGSEVSREEDAALHA
jgi:hypothetical protein